jgi:hypothetical protein
MLHVAPGCQVLALRRPRHDSPFDKHRTRKGQSTFRGGQALAIKQRNTSRKSSEVLNFFKVGTERTLVE